jgi:alanine racemase
MAIKQPHQLGIFEAGISQPNEMENLQRIIRPNYGIFTNIGQAHSENFNSIEEKAKREIKTFQDSEILIYCRDDEVIHQLIKKIFK